ncbi:MAG: proline--tRNA ligase [Spirochaetota bacterium]
MRLSAYIVPTLKEDPADAVVKSHRLMIRAGLIRKESAGMYAYLPLGLRALRKVTAIIRDEMDKAGAMECLMPELTSAELWKESGRWDTMGPEMFRITDRNSLEYALGPTHEEAFTALVRSVVSSYRELPVNVYQINTKFRDEIRPRFGVIRSKEFIMKDAYSFDIDADGLDLSYRKMAGAYRNIFRRCGLETIPVQADSGAMGGSGSEEFMVASEVGEETLLICPSCTYRANQERAAMKREVPERYFESGTYEEVYTPDTGTIHDLVSFFDLTPDHFLKSILYLADGEAVMAVVTGDREINEVKLKNHLQCTELELADDEMVQRVTGAPVGFAGPVNDYKIRTVCDEAVCHLRDAITGANKKDYHFKHVDPGRDFSVDDCADIITVNAGDPCPECSAMLSTRKGIEVGHIFKLGDKYTRTMNVTVLDRNGKAVTPVMGCYGIGVTRTLAAVVEQHNDDKGLIWPVSVAPFEIHLVGIAKGEEQNAQIDDLYESMVMSGLDVLYDDRKASPGVKFADADLIGLPVRVTCGRSFFTNGEVEIKVRKSGEQVNAAADTLNETLSSILKSLETGA